jgi:hypothetical protein
MDSVHVTVRYALLLSEAQPALRSHGVTLLPRNADVLEVSGLPKIQRA